MWGPWRAGLAAVGAVLATAASAHAHGEQATNRVLDERGNVVVLHSDARLLGLTPEQAARSWREQPRPPRVPRVGDAVVPAQTWCGDGGGRSTDDVEHARTTLPRYKVVYAHTAGNDRFTAPNVSFPGGPSIRRADVLQRAAGWIAGKLGTRGVRFDYGTSCGPQYVDVLKVQLPGSAAYYNASGALRPERVREDLRAARPSWGLDRGVWDFLVFADLGGSAPGGAPYAEAYLDDDPTPDPALNENARDGSFAFLWPGAFNGTFGIGYTAYVSTHELTHTLGAVVPGAPHRTSGRHCTDMYSVMCYDDGTLDGQSLSFDCAAGTLTPGEPIPESQAEFDAIPMDCGNDDYFNLAAGALGHWNVNRHPAVCDAARCLMSTIEPVAGLSADPGAATAGSPVRFDASSSTDRDGTLVRFDWDVDGDGAIDQSTPGPVLEVVPRRSGTVGGGRVTVVDEDELSDSRPLPAFAVAGRAPVMALSLPAAQPSGSTVVLDASGSFDPDDGGRIASFRFTLPDGTTTTQASPRLSLTPQRPGSSVVRVAGTDDEGRTAEAEATLTVLNRLPTVTARTDRARPATGATVLLSARADDPDGEVRTIAWDVDGDGATDETGAEVRAVFPDAGRRSVRVTVTDDQGGQATDRLTIDVVRASSTTASRRSTLVSLRRTRAGTVSAQVRCTKRRTCRLRVSAGTVRRDLSVGAGRSRSVRLRLPARLRSRTVRFTVQDRSTRRRLVLRTLAAPRR